MLTLKPAFYETNSYSFYFQVSNITGIKGLRGPAGPPGLNGTQGLPGPPGLNLTSCVFATADTVTRNNQGSAFSPRELASKVRSILSLLSIIDYNVLPLLLVINGGVLFLLFIIDCSCFY